MPARKIRDWSADELVSAATIAPDRYNDPGYSGVALINAQTWQEMKAAYTYKPGELIWVEDLVQIKGHWVKRGKKARVVDTLNSRDRDGWRQECYTVQYETKRGTWGKVAIKTWPGFIERGYQLAARGLTI